MGKSRRTLVTRVLAIALMTIGLSGNSQAQPARGRIAEALDNITTLLRSGRVGYATIWDGNIYVQCRRLPDRSLRCEAAGTLLQPSLRHVLTGDRLAALAQASWVLDASFGHHVRVFVPSEPTDRAAQAILAVLQDIYGADPAALQVQTAWVLDMPCPPRNGPSQNLAGLVNDAPSMRPTAIFACSYAAAAPPQTVTSAAELVDLYSVSVAAEIQRLRINAARRVHTVFDAGIGYIQCMPERQAAAIYCEAQSAESWPALAAILTPDRLGRLRRAGYAPPGRGPNHSRSYSIEVFDDVALAREILTLLHDVYGYQGAAALKVLTE
ncbi:TY-Chap domain-containing protein [Phreatobacter aquaticus]|uniref:TY-Chap domain-containing protein n=1 Tax=Phreatobacter aquaticus TaxID=2570229 RepID=UPI00208E1E37|nr:hypothetical protein [Phreatobacter aquaticus]